MQVSIVNFSDIPTFDLRFDPEFYEPKNLKLETLLRRHHSVPLGELCDLYDGPFGSELLSSSYSNDGVPALRMQNVSKDGLPMLGNVEFITENEANRLHKNIAFAGEVVTTKIGFLGYTTVLPNQYERYFFRRELTRLVIKENVKLRPQYLATFLNTSYGRNQALRYSTGTTRDRVLLVNQRYMLVPIFSESFQNFVEEKITKAKKDIEHSTKYFKEAENILLSELSLANWQPKHQLTFIKKYSDAEQAERIDAEYYQPKYEALIKTIKAYKGGWETLGNLVDLKDLNHTPKSDKQYKYIELSNIAGNGEITGCTTEHGATLPNRARRKVNEGDVIVSSVEGSLSSIALVGKEYDKSLCSTGFYVISSDFLNSETLLVLMKSIAGQMLLKRGCSGTILTSINKDEFLGVTLPKLLFESQVTIKQKVTESFRLRKQSKHLLECAKRAVEIAIEQDEQAAIDWLKNQIED